MHKYRHRELNMTQGIATAQLISELPEIDTSCSHQQPHLRQQRLGEHVKEATKPKLLQSVQKGVNFRNY